MVMNFFFPPPTYGCGSGFFYVCFCCWGVQVVRLLLEKPEYFTCDWCLQCICHTICLVLHCYQQSRLAAGERISHSPAFGIFPYTQSGPTSHQINAWALRHQQGQDFMLIVFSGRFRCRKQKWVILYLWLCQPTWREELGPLCSKWFRSEILAFLLQLSPVGMHALCMTCHIKAQSLGYKKNPEI